MRTIRVGNGANCSSVGSVIDTLFLGAAFGGAITAAVLAALREEEVRVVERSGEAEGQRDGNGGNGDDDDDRGRGGAVPESADERPSNEGDA